MIRSLYFSDLVKCEYYLTSEEEYKDFIPLKRLSSSSDDYLHKFKFHVITLTRNKMKFLLSNIKRVSSYDASTPKYRRSTRRYRTTTPYTTTTPYRTTTSYYRQTIPSYPETFDETFNDYYADTDIADIQSTTTFRSTTHRHMPSTTPSYFRSLNDDTEDEMEATSTNERIEYEIGMNEREIYPK